MLSMCKHLLIVTGISILGYFLYYSDKKRRLHQCYKYEVDQKQAEIKQKEIEEFKYRLLIFPASNKIKYIKKFVIREVYGITT